MAKDMPFFPVPSQAEAENNARHATGVPLCSNGPAECGRGFRVDIQQQRRAQQRADRIAAFRAELAELEREQGLTLMPDQQARLEAHLQRVLAELNRQFGADISEPERRISWSMRLVSLLGGGAFFAALFLFLQRIWGALPTAAQASVLVLIPLLLLAATAVCADRKVASYYLALLGLATGAAFVAGLSVLGSVFNTVPSPHALLVWGAFAVILAYATGLRLLLGAGLVLLCAWTAAWQATRGGAYWESFLSRGGHLIPGAVLLYALPVLSRGRQPHDFDFVYRMCGAAIGLIGLLILSKSPDPWCPMVATRTVETLYQVAGLVLSAGIVWHGLRLGQNGLVNLGAAGFITFLCVCLHGWWWDWMPAYLFFLLVGMTALGLLAVFRRLRRQLTERGSP